MIVNRLKKRWSILILVVFLGFGYFLKSRWLEVLKIEADNQLLEKQIAVKWRQSVARREAAALATAERNQRFQLRVLAAIFIDARVTGRSRNPEEMTHQTEKLSRLSVDELAAVIDELQASSFADDARIGIEAMLATALVARCTGETNHDPLIHRFLMNSRAIPEIARSLVDQMTAPDLRADVLHRLESQASP